jgi:predicted cupin superfamily sugar epimerase
MILAQLQGLDNDDIPEITLASLHGLTAAEIIKTLNMEPHPEGGYYVQTFRDEQGAPRGASTAIYYLLEKGQRSHWHKVKDASEVWLWHAGDALELNISDDGHETTSHILGMDLQAGERPQCIVKANAWQSAAPLGDWTLVSCTVAPGFVFSSFEMAPPDWEPS